MATENMEFRQFGDVSDEEEVEVDEDISEEEREIKKKSSEVSGDICDLRYSVNQAYVLDYINRVNSDFISTPSLTLIVEEGISQIDDAIRKLEEIKECMERIIAPMNVKPVYHKMR